MAQQVYMGTVTCAVGMGAYVAMVGSSAVPWVLHTRGFGQWRDGTEGLCQPWRCEWFSTLRSPECGAWSSLRCGAARVCSDAVGGARGENVLGNFRAVHCGLIAAIGALAAWRTRRRLLALGARPQIVDGGHRSVLSDVVQDQCHVGLDDSRQLVVVQALDVGREAVASLAQCLAQCLAEVSAEVLAAEASGSLAPLRTRLAAGERAL